MIFYLFQQLIAFREVAMLTLEVLQVHCVLLYYMKTMPSDIGLLVLVRQQKIEQLETKDYP